jgi:hypothetical protein
MVFGCCLELKQSVRCSNGREVWLVMRIPSSPRVPDSLITSPDWSGLDLEKWKVMQVFGRLVVTFLGLPSRDLDGEQ